MLFTNQVVFVVVDVVSGNFVFYIFSCFISVSVKMTSFNNILYHLYNEINNLVKTMVNYGGLEISLKSIPKQNKLLNFLDLISRGKSKMSSL